MHKQNIATDQMTQTESRVSLDKSIGFLLRCAKIMLGQFLVDLRQHGFRIGLRGRNGPRWLSSGVTDFASQQAEKNDGQRKARPP
ncbi:hypothetical protein [Duganella fentianensis]|uniref:hypothetical protein n=1 Tax=Duganella fentianensis TaxID=2692177 RepID=UPI0032B21C04